MVYSSQLEQLSGVGPLESTHIHADMKIYVNNEYVDLNKEEILSPEFGSLDFWRQAKVNRFTHLHAGENNIDVIHVHATGITLGMFIRSIGGKLEDDCLTLPLSLGGDAYCDSTNKKLNVFINGDKKINYGNYIIQDLDKILITYGTSDIQQQFDSIGNRACIQSKKC